MQQEQLMHTHGIMRAWTFLEWHVILFNRQVECERMKNGTGQTHRLGPISLFKVFEFYPEPKAGYSRVLSSLSKGTLTSLCSGERSRRQDQGEMKNLAAVAIILQNIMSASCKTAAAKKDKDHQVGTPTHPPSSLLYPFVSVREESVGHQAWTYIAGGAS